LPEVGPIFTRFVADHGLRSALQFVPGDFFNDDLPSADVLVMGISSMSGTSLPNACYLKRRTGPAERWFVDRVRNADR